MAAVTGLLDPDALKAEIVNYLRVQLNSLDTKSRQTFTSTLLNGNGSAYDYLVTIAKPKAVSLVEHPDNTPLAYGTNYSYDLNTANGVTVHFNAQPAAGTNNIQVDTYSGDTFVYPDYPKERKALSDFPFVVVDIISGSSDQNDIPAEEFNTMMTISITVYDYKTTRLDDWVKTVREKMMLKAKTFYHTPLVIPMGFGPLMVWNLGDDNKVLYRTIDFQAPFNFEVLS
jgi:hypothetical protein